MPVTIESESDAKILIMHLTGKLHKADYMQFVPEVDRALQQHQKIRLLIDMHDFHGETLAAAWEDFKFAIKHFNHFQRIALVGEKKWEHLAATFCKLFTTAAVRYFHRDQADAARDWIHAV